MAEEDARSILIVDDEVDACENLRDILSDLGYQVAIARNGHEAIEQVARSTFDIALLDLKMPGWMGSAFTGRSSGCVRKPSPLLSLPFAEASLPTGLLKRGRPRSLPSRLMSLNF